MSRAVLHHSMSAGVAQLIVMRLRRPSLLILTGTFALAIGLLIVSKSPADGPCKMLVLVSDYALTDLAATLVTRDTQEGDPHPPVQLFCGQQVNYAKEFGTVIAHYTNVLTVSLVLSNADTKSITIKSFGSTPQYAWALESTNASWGSDSVYMSGGGTTIPAGGTLSFSIRLPPAARRCWLSLDCWHSTWRESLRAKLPAVNSFVPSFVWYFLPYCTVRERTFTSSQLELLHGDP